MSQAKQPLLSKDLKILLVSMILANIGSMMMWPIMALYLTSMGADVRQVGLFFTLSSIFPILVQILGGWVSDTIGRVRAIALGSMAGMIAYIPFLLATSYWWLLLGQALFAVTTSLVGPSFAAFTAEETELEKRGRAFGATKSIFLIVNVIGPVMGGWIAENLSFRMMFLISAIFYLGATSIRITMAHRLSPQLNQDPDQEQRLDLASLKKQLGKIGTLFLAGSVITWILIIDGIRDTSFRLSFELTPIYLEQLGGLSLTQIGILESIVGVTAMMLTPLAGILVDRKSERFVIALGSVTVSAAFTFFLISHSMAGFAVAWALFGISWGLMDPAYDSLISKAVPQKMLGTAYGFFDSSLGLVSLPAPWLGGQLWSRISPRMPFILTMIVNTLSIWPIWTKFRLPVQKTIAGTDNANLPKTDGLSMSAELADAEMPS